MSDDHLRGDEVKETEHRQRDVAALPEAVRKAARFSGPEVMWPKTIAHEAIDRLVEAGHIVLGVDLRKYETEGRFSIAGQLRGQREPLRTTNVLRPATPNENVFAIGCQGARVRSYSRASALGLWCYRSGLGGSGGCTVR